MFAAKQVFLASPRTNKEEEMYKELFKATVERRGSSALDLVDSALDRVGTHAFENCTFRNVILENVETFIGERNFYYAKIYGDTISLPKLLSVGGAHALGNASFYGGTISAPMLQVVLGTMFYNTLQRNSGAVRPTAVNIESATEIQDNAFRLATGMYRLYAPRVTKITGRPFLNISRRYCGENRSVARDECALILGSAELDTGMTMADLVSNGNFPFGAESGDFSPTWYCRDGIVSYDTAQAAWVQTPYS